MKRYYFSILYFFSILLVCAQDDTDIFLPSFVGHTSQIYDVVFSPDGTKLLSGSMDGTAKLWNAINGELIFTYDEHTDYVTDIDFSPDGSTVITASQDKTIKLWDVNTGSKIKEIDTTDDRDYKRSATSLMYSSGGKSVLAGFGFSNAKMIDLSSGNILHTYTVDSYIREAILSPDDARVAIAGSTNAVLIFDTNTEKLIQQLHGHRNEVNHVCFSRDGRMLLSSSHDGNVKLWNVDTWSQDYGKLINTFDIHAYDYYSIEFSPDNKLLLIGNRILDINSGDVLLTFPDSYPSSFTPDGAFVVVGCYPNKLQLYDVTLGSELEIIDDRYEFELLYLLDFELSGGSGPSLLPTSTDDILVAESQPSGNYLVKYSGETREKIARTAWGIYFYSLLPKDRNSFLLYTRNKNTLQERGYIDKVYKITGPVEFINNWNIY